MQNEILKTDAYIISAGTVVGKKEHDGPLGDKFDFHSEDDRFGMDTWERAEGEMQRMALACALSKTNMQSDALEAIFAGDLLNQCVGSSGGILSFGRPFFGLYGACSTAAEGLILASSLVSAGYYDIAAAVTSSHNAAAERQFRTPIEYGGQRPPTGQWTVTGSGAFIVAPKDFAERPLSKISACLPGIPVEMGVCDPNNMGAAMAPAAESTLLRFFKQSGTRPEDYDLIATGDLGYEGASILAELMRAEGYELGKNYCDCGMMIFSRNTQDTHCGGSGCACSATVFGAYILPRIQSGQLKRVIFMGTGALMNPDSVKQGTPIAGIGHLLVAEHTEV